MSGYHSPAKLTHKMNHHTHLASVISGGRSPFPNKGSGWQGGACPTGEAGGELTVRELNRSKGVRGKGSARLGRYYLECIEESWQQIPCFWSPL